MASVASTPAPPPLVRMASRSPGSRLDVPSDLDGGKEFVEAQHAQKAGAAERGVVDGVGAGAVRPYANCAALAAAGDGGRP